MGYKKKDNRIKVDLSKITKEEKDRLIELLVMRAKGSCYDYNKGIIDYDREEEYYYN